MEISLNGEPRQIEEGTTLQGLVGTLQLPDRALADRGQQEGDHAREVAGSRLAARRSGGTGACDRRRLMVLR